ncbi:helix-turn-helix transcriptional regulator [Kineosporia sp. J2-2]|uniref:Helix-turn-helix transcriptional regulator n=1 Tax=Kineosporia corallincola TaxID=2835133 RepID=A0ABS5TK88_9ACTN|nr:LuxR C-terminal-related transcriptional regulator [Kineosporia corallincola]MBT0771507.1 helix-turn-helix transcriptional regulator [Kineosporia corallincola]
MDWIERESGRWLEVLTEALDAVSTAFPARLLATELRASLDARAVSLNWAGTQGHGRQRGAEVWPPIVPQHHIDDFVQGAALFRDPLVDWLDRTQLVRPQTCARVPPGFGDEASFAGWRSLMQDFGIDQRLAVPLRLGPRSHLAFVAGREGDDFTDAQIALARRVRPALAALHRQAQTLGALPEPVVRAGAGSRLTGRELAVLAGLQGGSTASSIARQLDISERTVHKHLERIYRKLRVNDRLSAVIAAQYEGLLPVRTNAYGRRDPDG